MYPHFLQGSLNAIHVGGISLLNSWILVGLVIFHEPCFSENIFTSSLPPRCWQLKYFVQFSPHKLGKVSNLTSISFRWVETTNQFLSPSFSNLYHIVTFWLTLASKTQKGVPLPSKCSICSFLIGFPNDFCQNCLHRNLKEMIQIRFAHIFVRSVCESTS